MHLQLERLLSRDSDKTANQYEKMTKILLEPNCVTETSGRSSNYAECHKADSKDLIEVADGAAFLCPVCGSALEEGRVGQRKKTARSVPYYYHSNYNNRRNFVPFGRWDDSFSQH